MRCFLGCHYKPYEEPTEDGGYIMGLRCARCGSTQRVARVTKKGAELQKRLSKLRGLQHAKLLPEFQKEVTRL